MNQILSVESPKKEKKIRNSGTIEIEKILKFFSIAILVFGVFMIGSGSYSMYQNSKMANLSSKPTIYVQEISATDITLQITHNKELSRVTYNWNDEDSIEIDCEGKKKVEKQIEIPTGENTLNVYAIDINGQETTFTKTYTIQGDINIELEAEEEGNDIKITAEGKEQLLYMTYRWDDEEETRIDINDMIIEQTVEIPKGLHKLTIIVVDINNKTETKEQEVKGVTKPKIDVVSDESGNFVIKTSDEEGIKKVEFTINETETYLLNLNEVFALDERKEFEYSYPLYEGENIIKVIVYNESDISEETTITLTK